MNNVLTESEFSEIEYSTIKNFINDELKKMPWEKKCEGNELFKFENYSEAASFYRMSLLSIAEIFKRNIVSSDNETYALIKEVQVSSH